MSDVFERPRDPWRELENEVFEELRPFLNPAWNPGLAEHNVRFFIGFLRDRVKEGKDIITLRGFADDIARRLILPLSIEENRSGEGKKAPPLLLHRSRWEMTEMMGKAVEKMRFLDWSED